MELWKEKKTNTNGILLVTHNIDEAAILADRIIVFGSNPGTIRAELEVKLKHPRNDQDIEFRNLVDQVYMLMTTRPDDMSHLLRTQKVGIDYRLPDVNIEEITGLLETLDATEHRGRMDLPEVADYLSLNIDDLFPVTEVLEILRFANVSKGDIEITLSGRAFVNADILERKKIFATHLLKYVPLAQHIRKVLDERPGHRAAKERFLNELEDFLSEQEARRVLKIIIDWGRYARNICL